MSRRRPRTGARQYTAVASDAAQLELGRPNDVEGRPAANLAPQAAAELLDFSTFALIM